MIGQESVQRCHRASRCNTGFEAMRSAGNLSQICSDLFQGWIWILRYYRKLMVGGDFASLGHVGPTLHDSYYSGYSEDM